jgi:hypothetical protein
MHFLFILPLQFFIVLFFFCRKCLSRRSNVPRSSTDDNDFIDRPKSSARRNAGCTGKRKVADVQNEKKVFF